MPSGAGCSNNSDAAADQHASSTSDDDMVEGDVYDWVRCCECAKWRKLEQRKDVGSLPKNWRCADNVGAGDTSCDADEETYYRLEKAYLTMAQTNYFIANTQERYAAAKDAKTAEAWWNGLAHEQRWVHAHDAYAWSETPCQSWQGLDPDANTVDAWRGLTGAAQRRIKPGKVSIKGIGSVANILDCWCCAAVCPWVVVKSTASSG